MKKNLIAPLIVIVALCCISWGYNGHRTIGLITENYLSASAKVAVKELLGDTSIAEACTWADDARKETAFAATANWHFLNLPLGLTFDEFKHYIDTTSKANVYSALLDAEKTLGNQQAARQEKVYALKFLMHFVGDLHQPMHISRAEDKGGSTIQLNFEGKGTNLHSLWDTKLLEKQGLTFTQVAEKYAKVDPILVKKWQNEPPIQWIWESYQISSELYTEIESLNKRVIDDSYYQKHLPTIELRIKQAAVRLAGTLNRIYGK